MSGLQFLEEPSDGLTGSKEEVVTFMAPPQLELEAGNHLTT